MFIIKSVSYSSWSAVVMFVYSYLYIYTPSLLQYESYKRNYRLVR